MRLYPYGRGGGVERNRGVGIAPSIGVAGGVAVGVAVGVPTEPTSTSNEPTSIHAFLTPFGLLPPQTTWIGK
jgi:hypothetical protein